MAFTTRMWPTAYFKEVAKDIARDIEGADIAGFNSNRFDVPVLVEEFLPSLVSTST